MTSYMTMKLIIDVCRQIQEVRPKVWWEMGEKSCLFAEDVGEVL